MFLDTVTVTLQAGKGGNGVVAWRREKYIPKGGPVGGNGGNGGSIYVKTDARILSLESFRNRRIIAAEDGMSGGGNLRKGRSGKDLILSIPAGTLITDVDQGGALLFDCTADGQEILMCRGGKGGKGNHCFKSPTQQAPNICTSGIAGQRLSVKLELKLIADVGLVGMPNAGKSTLMSQITDVPVKIGAYPFTTLRPNLSYVRFPDFSRVLVADIPGIIERAHENKGLGSAFLRHIERSNVLLFVIDVSGFEGRDPWSDFQILRKELQEYCPTLLDKPFLVVLNKIDQEGAERYLAEFLSKYPFQQHTLFPISAMRREGLDPLLQAMRALLP